MARSRNYFSSAQGNLFQQLEQPSVIDSPNAPDLDIGPELMGAINTAIREAKQRTWGRDRIVQRMNLALPNLQKPLTKRQLDSWTASSKEYSEFPLRYLAAFCWATGCDVPLRVLASALGMGLVDAREAAAKKLGETAVAIAQLRRQQTELTHVLESGQ